MNTYQKIRAIEEKLDNGQERNACITAERILFNAVAIRVHRVTAEDFINTLDGKPVKKERLDSSEAMEAQKRFTNLAKGLILTFRLSRMKMSFYTG